MSGRPLWQHALAAALFLLIAITAVWMAGGALALKTTVVPAAAPGIHIPNLGNNLNEQTRNLSRMSQALRTGDRLVIMGSSELTSHDLRFVPYRFLADELQMPVLAYGHSGFQSLGIQLVLAAMAEDLSPTSRVVVMLSPGWFDGEGGLGTDEFKEHANPLLPRLIKQADARAQMRPWLEEHANANLIWSMLGEQAYVFRQRLVDLWTPAYAALPPSSEPQGPGAAARVVDWDKLAQEAQQAEQVLMTRNRYAVRDDFFNKYLSTLPPTGKKAYAPQALTGRAELRELNGLMALLRKYDVNALFVMQPLHPMVFNDLPRFEPIRQQVQAMCKNYGMVCMDMYDSTYEIGTLRDVQHLGELGWLQVNRKIVEVFRP